MNTLKKIFLGKNLGLTIVLVLSIILFVWSAKGDIIQGAITAFAAVMIVACIYILYKEYKSTPAPKKPVKKARK